MLKTGEHLRCLCFFTVKRNSASLFGTLTHRSRKLEITLAMFIRMTFFDLDTLPQERALGSVSKE